MNLSVNVKDDVVTADATSNDFEWGLRASRGSELVSEFCEGALPMSNEK
jgi:hypothetical protein